MQSPRTILKSQVYCKFSPYSQVLLTFVFPYFFSPLSCSPHLVFLFLFHPPPAPTLFTPVRLYFLLPHVYSFPSPIPSYTPCPLTLNHRWTKQWPMSHSIKTNNPVMGGGLCGAGATVTRQYAHWSKQPLISDSDDTIHKWTLKAACTHTRSQPHAKKNRNIKKYSYWAAFLQKVFFSCVRLHSPLSFSSLIHQWEV